MSNILVWSTDSVDTSAMLLAQALDAEFTKSTLLTGELKDQLTKEDSKVLCYGCVNLSDQTKELLTEDNLFQNPDNARLLLQRHKVSDYLEANGVTALKHYKVSNDTTFTSLREKLGVPFCLTSTIGGTPTATVKNSQEFNNAKGASRWARANVETSKRFRLLLGIPEVQGVIGAAMSEYKTLSFKETVMFGSNDDAEPHLQNLFDKGILTEEMGKGMEAWTEEAVLSAAELQAAGEPMPMFEKIASLMYSKYKTDFCAVDVVMSSQDGSVKVTNMTSCPSLQSDRVLHLTAEYYSNLIKEGRNMTQAQLVELAKSLDDKQRSLLAKLLKQAKAL